MLTRNVSVVDKINNAAVTAQATVASIRDTLSVALKSRNVKVYELAESTVARLRKDSTCRWFIVAVCKPDRKSVV